MITILDERKLSILMEIVESFIDNEEPVGSETLSKKSSINVSAATIRNEMRDLEKVGLLSKTHRSSGRIPSSKAFSIYVNYVLDSDILPSSKFINEINKAVANRHYNMDEILEISSGMLADETEYTAVIVSPKREPEYIRYFSINMVDKDKIIVVFIDEYDRAKSHIIYYGDFLDIKEVIKYRSFLGEYLLFKNIKDLSDVIENMAPNFPNRKLSIDIITLGIEFLKKGKDYSIYSSGLSNILRFGNDDLDSMMSLIQYLEDEDNLISLGSPNHDNLSITIGMDNKKKALKDSSIISARYNISDSEYGNIKLIGPIRMDYKPAIETIMALSLALSSIDGLIKR